MDKKELEIYNAAKILLFAFIIIGFIFIFIIIKLKILEH